MKIGIYAVRDTKAEAFMQPLFFNAEGIARRSFSEAVNDSKSIIGKYPGDFDLYKLGTFDDESGEIHSHLPKNLVNGASLVEAVPGDVASPNGSGPITVR